MLDDNVENDLTNGSRNFARWSVKVQYSGKSSDLRETPKPKFVFEFDCEFIIQKFELSNLTHCPISLVSSTLELFGGWLISRDDWPNSHQNWEKGHFKWSRSWSSWSTEITKFRRNPKRHKTCILRCLTWLTVSFGYFRVLWSCLVDDWSVGMIDRIQMRIGKMSLWVITKLVELIN